MLRPRVAYGGRARALGLKIDWVAVRYYNGGSMLITLYIYTPIMVT